MIFIDKPISVVLLAGAAFLVLSPLFKIAVSRLKRE
jgi:TctA family transporter